MHNRPAALEGVRLRQLSETIVKIDPPGLEPGIFWSRDARLEGQGTTWEKRATESRKSSVKIAVNQHLP